MAIMMAFNEQVQEDVRRMEQFNIVMQNAKPLMTLGKGKNMKIMTASASIPLSLLRIDDKYQGMRKHKKINNLFNNWDFRKLSPIVVSPHPEDGTYYIVDGQGRFTVAKRKGMESLWAVLLMDMPEDPDERLKVEAEYYISQDLEVEPVKAVEKHCARCIIGDRAAIDLNNLMETYGISFTCEKGNRKMATLGSYDTTYGISKVHGKQCLDFAFSIIENAGWNKEKNGYSADMMSAFRNIWYEYREDRDTIHKFLSKRLRNISPAQFKSEADSKYPGRGHTIQITLLMEDLVCNEIGTEKRYYKAELEKDKRNNKH